MAYRYTDFVCIKCDTVEEIMHPKDEVPESVPCPGCNNEMVRKFPAPLVMRAGFADGQKRGDRWTLAKQSAKLEQEAIAQRRNGNKEAYKEIMAESKRVNKMATTKRDKTDK